MTYLVSGEKYRYEPDFKRVTRHYTCAKTFVSDLENLDMPWHSGGLAGWVFRGQVSAAWLLTPSLFRNQQRVGTSYEYQAIESYMRTGNLAGLDVPARTFIQAFPPSKTRVPLKNRRTGEELREYDFNDSIFAHAQHHGVSTRFLDFTYDPLIAAYFAANMYPYFLTQLGIEEYRNNLIERIRKLQEEGLPTKIVPSKMVVWAIEVESLEERTSIRLLDFPYSQIRYMKVQKGVFLCDLNRPDVSGNLERLSFDRQLIDLANDETPRVYRLTIQMDQNSKLGAELRRRNITVRSVTPNWETVANDTVRTLDK